MPNRVIFESDDDTFPSSIPGYGQNSVKDRDFDSLRVRVSETEGDIERLQAKDGATDRELRDLWKRINDHEVRLKALERLAGPTPTPKPPVPDLPGGFPTPSPGPIPGGVPEFSYEVLWRDSPPIHSLEDRTLRAAAAWCEFVNDKRYVGKAEITVQSISTWIMTAQGEQLMLFEDDYRKRPPRGGLFQRDPWYAGGDSREPLPFTQTAEGAVFLPDTHPDKVWHLWPSQRSIFPANTKRIFSRLVYRGSGTIAVRAGVDHFESTTSPVQAKVTHAEGSRGKWYYAFDRFGAIYSGRPGEIDEVTPPKWSSVTSLARYWIGDE